MQTDQDPPSGYYFGHPSGRMKCHLVKIGDFNSTAVCGVQCFNESFIDSGYGVSRVVCEKCYRILSKEKTKTL